MGYSLQKSAKPADEMPSIAAEQGLWQRSGANYRAFVPWVVASVIIIIWAVVAALGIFPASYVPSPLRVAQDVGILTTQGFAGVSLLTDILASMDALARALRQPSWSGFPLDFGWLPLKWCLRLSIRFCNFCGQYRR